MKVDQKKTVKIVLPDTIPILDLSLVVDELLEALGMTYSNISLLSKEPEYTEFSIVGIKPILIEKQKPLVTFSDN